MPHTYKDDTDLAVLNYANNEMLEVLAKLLIFDKNGKNRNTESLSSNKEFIEARGEYVKCWKPIAAEIQHFGGDSVVNFVRGSGVQYKEILVDVCKRLKVKTDFKADSIEIEQAMLAKIVEVSWKDMSEEQQTELASALNIDGKLAGPAIMAAMITAIQLGGFASYQVALIIANSIAKMVMGKGLQLAANAGISRAIGVFAGPIGWVITGLLTVPALSGAAFRVTLPAVIQVAAIRQQLEHKEHF